MENTIYIERVNGANFALESMDAFDRMQHVENIYRVRDGKLMLERNPWDETWTLERRREKAREILSGEYTAFCAYRDGHVVGEIMLAHETRDGRMILDSLHVSRECRRMGAGRMLFERARAEAKERGARALYISACCAEETVKFYLAMGCRLSEKPIREMAEKEPWDLQMECPVDA